MDTRDEMWSLINRLFPICRSITGEGLRQTLSIISEHIPIQVHEIPSGTQVFDWTVPREWNIRDAYIADESGNKIVDFRKSNLHVVGYSTPVDAWLDLDDLQDHLYSLPEQPDAIPYITSYYRERWGFCLTHEQRLQLEPGKYHAYIDSDLADGHLTYGELVIPGQTDDEVFLSTYVCHPSMANNELSGPVVMTSLVKWLMSEPRRYTYRIIFIPETIGSITYLSRNHAHLSKHVIAGFNLSCIGDERTYSLVASRYGNTLADRVAENVLKHRHPDHLKYSYLDRGSDERQYCSPGIDLPLVTLCRSKYSSYPEYHTSLDNLDFVTADGLQGGLDYVRDCLMIIEANRNYKITCQCEPQLGKRGLYPTLSTKETGRIVATMMDTIAYADGSNSLLEISELINKPVNEIIPIAEKLLASGLLVLVESDGNQTRLR